MSTPESSDKQMRRDPPFSSSLIIAGGVSGIFEALVVMR
jgi:hypothetical protein